MAKRKKKSKIYIKPSRRGAFTRWCKAHGFGGVNARCIRAGLKSKDPRVRKMANFARNARKWN